MSKKAHEEMRDEAYPREPISCGAFQFDSSVSGSHIVMKKNPDYWKPGLPKLEEIIFRFIPDPSMRLESLLKGEIDLRDRPEGKGVPKLREMADIDFDSVPGWNWDYMPFTLGELQ